jgi:drug/metabolite transporter (DMT)-like permease
MVDPHRAKERKAEVLLLAVVVIWASNYPIAKWGLEGLDPMLFNGVRYVVAALVLGVLFFHRMHWTAIAGKDWRLLIRAGIIANVIYQIAFILGLDMTSAGNAAILLNTSPLWTLLLSSRLHKEAVGRTMWLGAVISLCGVAMIILGSGKKLQFGGLDVYGDLLSFGAAAFWGLSTNLQKPLVAKYPTLQVTFVMIAVGAVGLGLAAIPSATTTPWAATHWTYITAACVSGALSIGVANYFWSSGVKHLGPGRTATYSTLVPVLAFIISYFTLHEELFPVHFVGAAVTVFGVWHARR